MRDGAAERGEHREHAGQKRGGERNGRSGEDWPAAAPHVRPAALTPSALHSAPSNTAGPPTPCSPRASRPASTRGCPLWEGWLQTVPAVLSCPVAPANGAKDGRGHGAAGCGLRQHTGGGARGQAAGRAGKDCYPRPPALGSGVLGAPRPMWHTATSGRRLPPRPSLMCGNQWIPPRIARDFAPARTRPCAPAPRHLNVERHLKRNPETMQVGRCCTGILSQGWPCCWAAVCCVRQELAAGPAAAWAGGSRRRAGCSSRRAARCAGCAVPSQMGWCWAPSRFPGFLGDSIKIPWRFPPHPRRRCWT